MTSSITSLKDDDRDVVVPDYLLADNQISSDVNIGLFKAALAGSLYGVENNLKKGAKPNFFYRPEDQKNSLHIASEKGFYDIVELLLLHQAEVNSIATTDQTSALLLSCQNDNINLVKLLLEKGANIHHANGYGNTALHEACRMGHNEIINCLLSAGANVNTQNHKGSTPFHIYCYGEDIETHSLEGVTLLLNAGASTTKEDLRGMTPGLVCCASGRVDILKLLQQSSQGCDLTVTDSKGQSAIEIARFYGHEAMIDYLQSKQK